MNKDTLTANLSKPVTKLYLINSLCKGKRVLDLGCLNHNICNTQASNWLHGYIKNVASYLVGVDYLETEVAELRAQGFNVICADINKPILIDDKFDVIHVGNLIEHLSNFEGLFNNFYKLLNPDGVIIITTPNPFYINQYFYTALKNNIIVNSEHTCWFDPLTLDQLAKRYGFETTEVYWLKEKWHLFWVILNGDKFQYDIMTGEWHISRPLSVIQSVIGNIILFVTRILFNKKYTDFKLLHSDNIAAFAYIYAISKIFHFMWSLYKLLIIKSKLNNYELFASILKKN